MLLAVRPLWITTLVLLFIPQIASPTDKFNIRTISSRPDTVSGDSTLAEMDAPAEPNIRIYLNRRDVTHLFRASDQSTRPLALLDGLKIGRNRLEVRMAEGSIAKLDIINHSLSGPIFSGPQQQPFFCQTQANGLGSALDAACDTTSIVQYYYKSTQPSAGSSIQSDTASLPAGFNLYRYSESRPTDVAQITTSDGQVINFVVRREMGAINRAVYQIEFLYEPGEPLPTPWSHKGVRWNGTLIYLFGGGCGGGYQQGVLSEAYFQGYQKSELLEKGYALASSTLNIMGITCNDRVSAETASMVKEHFIKEYGEPKHTIGVGASGGAAAVHLIAQNYPGILDGIIPFYTSQDMVTSGIPILSDCALLGHAFNESRHSWTEPQKAAASGFATWETCAGVLKFYGSAAAYFNPEDCDPSLPKEVIYDPLSNPRGARCSYYDNEVNVFGRDPSTGFARRTIDNVGVQYGLIAFNAGKIDAEQFVELNERIGGYNRDGRITRMRTVGDLDAIRAAYKYGSVLLGDGLTKLPIIEWSPYGDDLGDIHTRDHSFAVRARLVAAGGDASNQVILVTPRPISDAADTRRGVGLSVLVPQMDHWLSNIDADAAGSSFSEKISRNKPTELLDGCIAPDGERISEPAYSRNGRCNEMYPINGTPRVAAGEPIASDFLKCSLKPINPAEYSKPLMPRQIARLRAAFPLGVCDYGKPGIGHQHDVAAWSFIVE